MITVLTSIVEGKTTKLHTVYCLKTKKSFAYTKWRKYLGEKLFFVWITLVQEHVIQVASFPVTFYMDEQRDIVFNSFY